jgi:NUMOD3 motif
VCCGSSVIEPMFYVYEHARPDGTVFYIGKGTHTPRKGFGRSTATQDRSVFWRRTVARAGGFTASVVAVCRDEELAFRVERALIALYGRRVTGGSLCNLTTGGDGHSGLSPSEETRARLREANSGERHANWGKRLSAETCARKSAAMKASPKNLRGKKLPQWWRDKIRAGKLGSRNPMFGRPSRLARRVVDRDTGLAYPSVTAAAVAFQIRMQTLHNMLTGFRKNTTTLEFA